MKKYELIFSAKQTVEIESCCDDDAYLQHAELIETLGPADWEFEELVEIK